MSKLLTTNGQVLNKEELKQVGGGKTAQLTCWCNNGQGGFSPNPNASGAELVNLMMQYCGGSGATCYPVEV